MKERHLKPVGWVSLSLYPSYGTDRQPGLRGLSTRLITYVKDRPGHDGRYAIDASKIHRELGWKPAETFKNGIRKTVKWYLDNMGWVDNVTSGAYREWIGRQYAT